MANEIDRLMDLDPLELSAQDLDDIIAYQRKARASFEAGVKPKKGSGEKISADDLLSKLGMGKPKPPDGFKRRF